MNIQNEFIVSSNDTSTIKSSVKLMFFFSNFETCSYLLDTLNRFLQVALAVKNSA